VGTEVIVLNGGSSSGKSSIARCLQALLGPTWLTLGIDDLIRALPGGNMPFGEKPSIDFGPDGSVTVSDDFRRAEAAWYRGLAAIARCGTGLIVDEVFLDGRASQERLARTLSASTVLWVGVRCEAGVAEARERERHDRVVGMARRQADEVHEGVVYSLSVDTTATSAMECARTITRHLAGSEK
jgi:chloramphenicol 3-O phosphotransferase